VLATTLSGHLPVNALVGHYLTNKLIGRRPILVRITPLPPQKSAEDYRELVRLSTNYARDKGLYLRVINPFAGLHADVVAGLLALSQNSVKKCLISYTFFRNFGDTVLILQFRHRKKKSLKVAL